jgi:hypothetical protein
MSGLKRLLLFSSFIVMLTIDLLGCPVFSISLNEEKNITDEICFIPEPEDQDWQPVFQKGLCYSAWSPDAYETPESDESLLLLTETNTEWVSICLSWVQTNTTSNDIHPDLIKTPTIASVRHAILRAHNLGLKVMLKPMVDTLEPEKTQGYPTVWRGEILPSKEWFESYSNFINYFAEIAEQSNVEMFCIGCELKATTNQKTQWENLINDIRARYSGPITYAADWTNYKYIEWWDSLDYVGIDAYFFLTLFNNDPTIEELKSAWNNHANEIEEWISNVNKPLIFTEIGYRSGDGTAMAPSNYWSNMPIDLQEQNDCYEAAFQTLWNRNWFYGFYWWTWIHYPNKGGLNDNSHTPQNKPVENIITEWYSNDRRLLVLDKTFTSASKSNINQIQQISFHVSWENDGTDVVGAQVFVNGTEYTTNTTGWINFSVTSETSGKSLWTITDIQHPTANNYIISIDPPSIIWEKLIFQINVDSTVFGTIKVKTTLENDYDGTLVTGANIKLNDVSCQEIEPGVYEGQIFTWSPYPQLTVTTNTLGLEGESWETSTIHILNSLVYLAIIVGVCITMIMILNWRRNNQTK